MKFPSFGTCLALGMAMIPGRTLAAQDWLAISPVYGSTQYRIGRETDSVFRSLTDHVGKVALVEIHGATLGVALYRLDDFIAVRMLVWNPSDSVVEFDSEAPVLFDQNHVALRRFGPDVVANSLLRKVRGAPLLPPKMIIRSQGQSTASGSRYGPTTVTSRSTTTVEEDPWVGVANAIGAIADRKLMDKAERTYREGSVGPISVESQSASKGATYFERPDHDDRLFVRIRGVTVEIPFMRS